jgi:signal transduction histidine kinase
MFQPETDMATPMRVAVLAGQVSAFEKIAEELRRSWPNVECRRVDNEPEYLAVLQEGCDVILASGTLSGREPARALRLLSESGTDTPFVVIGEAPDGGEPGGTADGRLAGLGPLIARAIAEKVMRAQKARMEAELSRSREYYRRLAEELARSNKDLEDFAYVASHDLQEPLRMVSSYAELLAERYMGRLGPDADEFIGFITEGVGRMQVLIRDLLAYSRVSTRSRDFVSTDSGTVFEKALDNLRAAILESGVSVTRGALPVVQADPGQLAQVFQNLIGNSIKFRRAEAPFVRVAAEESAGEWTFSVADNGIGIDPQYHQCIFNLFNRLHTTQEYGGTGIGLAVCKKIVERHGGRTWVESTAGEGSTFHFTISKTNGAGP